MDEITLNDWLAVASLAIPAAAELLVQATKNPEVEQTTILPPEIAAGVLALAATIRARCEHHLERIRPFVQALADIVLRHLGIDP